MFCKSFKCSDRKANRSRVSENFCGIASIGIIFTSLLTLAAVPFTIAQAQSGNDDSNLPIISINAVNGIVTEGEDARFVIDSSTILDEDLIVNLQANQDGDFILWRVPAKVQIDTTTNMKVVNITTDDDELDESDGKIEVSIVYGDDYVVGSQSTAEIFILDNDIDDTGTGIAKPGATVANVALDAILTDANVPKVAITPLNRIVENGREASFLITANPAPGQSLDISLDVMQSGDTSESRTLNVKLDANRTSFPVRLETSSGASGELSVSVKSGSGYKVGSPSVAAITVE